MWEEEASASMDGLENEFLDEISLQLDLKNPRNSSIVAENILQTAKVYNRKLSDAQAR